MVWSALHAWLPIVQPQFTETLCKVYQTSNFLTGCTKIVALIKVVVSLMILKGKVSLCSTKLWLSNLVLLSTISGQSEVGSIVS